MRTSSILAALVTVVAIGGAVRANPSTNPQDAYNDPKTGIATWVAPSEDSIPNNETGELIRYGRLVASQSPKYIGPLAKKPYVKTMVACTNCHIADGTAPFSASWAVSNYKYGEGKGDYSVRFHQYFDMAGRIDFCMTRGLVGEALPRDSREMRGLMAYMNWLATGMKVKEWKKVAGRGFIKLEPLDRPVDPKRGKQVYQVHCASCHGDDGSGSIDTATNEIIYPPLFGPKSFGVTAGLFLFRAAGFIKANMPYGWANSANPERQLSDEDAWDVAAYVIYQDRPPGISDGSQDWPGDDPNGMPSWMSKPPDVRYPPFYPRVKPDGTLTGDLKYPPKYSEARHRYGPYKEMLADQKKIQDEWKKDHPTTPSPSPAPTQKPHP